MRRRDQRPWEPDVPILCATYPRGGLPACREVLPHRSDVAIQAKAKGLGLRVDQKALREIRLMNLSGDALRKHVSRHFYGPPKPTPELLELHRQWVEEQAFLAPVIHRIVPAGEWRAEVPGPRSVFELAEAR